MQQFRNAAKIKAKVQRFEKEGASRGGFIHQLLL